MAARRAERLVNLVICLLSTRQFVTAEHIRNAVPGYESGGSGAKADEAFKRMFERDKAELRDLGVPLETGRNSIFDADDGYRIMRRDYELPAIEFDPAEAAAVGLAGRLWQSATLGAPARSALIKLRAGGTDVDVTAPAGASPHIDASDPSLPVLIEASRTSRVVSFDYLKLGEDEPSTRVVEPWGVLSWRARWYLVGHDRDRDEPRSFRLSRLVGPATAVGEPRSFERPEGVRLLDYVTRRPVEARQVAVVAVSGTRAGALRRMARSEVDGRLEIEYSDADRLVRLIAGSGRHARVVSPPELVDQVRARLRAAAGLPPVESAATVPAGAPA